MSTTTSIATVHTDCRERTVLRRSIGAAVLSGAGTWWSWFPVGRLPMSPVITHTMLVTVAAILFVAALRAISADRRPVGPVDRRLMMASMLAEIPSIVVGVILVEKLGYPDLVMPVVGLVVGLHFLPLARALAYPPYRVLGVAVTAICMISALFPEPLRLTFLGAGIGASLLATSLHMTLRLRARGHTA